MKSDDKITPKDMPLVRQWLNCKTASFDADDYVWVEGPMCGRWLKPKELEEFRRWRSYMRAARDGGAE